MKLNNSSYKFLIVLLLSVAVSCQKDDNSPQPVIDIQGNSYRTITIENDVWMAENLKTTLFNDGTEIELVTGNEDWHQLKTPGYCWYENNESEYKDIYGALYNGYTISSGKICPAGWHVPSLEEFDQLLFFLGDSLNVGGKLKEEGITHWHSPNKGADNSSGFTALGSGIRYFEGSFNTFSYYTSIWSSTEKSDGESWYLSLYYSDPTAILNHKSKGFGFSVRCVKD